MKVLYICTHNRCRSILAEAITNHLGGPELQARSAGSQPAGEVHPLTLQYLEEAGIPSGGLRSQSWDELESFAPDLVITVCDRAAGEQCPLWIGKALRLHWSLEDPSAPGDTPEASAQAFRSTIALLSQRVEALRPFANLSGEGLQTSNIKSIQ